MQPPTATEPFFIPNDTVREALDGDSGKSQGKTSVSQVTVKNGNVKCISSRNHAQELFSGISLALHSGSSEIVHSHVLSFLITVLLEPMIYIIETCNLSPLIHLPQHGFL